MRQVMLRLAILFFAFTLVSEANAQTKTQQIKLSQLAKTYSLEFQREKEAAIKRADSLGLPVRQEFDNGRVIELMRFESGRPVYATTYNAEGADLLKSNEVYSGGMAGLNLSGSGQTLALWDAGIVRSTHVELAGRVSIGDGSGTVNNHATHVGGTMIASGSDANAKGMSPQASLDSYDWNSDQSEMASAASSGLQLSVHPYGYITGWGQISGDWYWYGDASETEDYSFGFYDATYAQAWDNIAYNAPNYLIIAPAGNNRGEIAPQTVRDDGNYYVYDGSGFVLCSDYAGCNNNYEEDGGPDGFDSMSYHSLAKNVIAVGAVDAGKNLLSISGLGPADDGRIKPDIVAKGVGVYSSNGPGDSAYNTRTGTSHSAPMIGGASGLLLEHQEDLYPGEKLLSSTLKALILHTAEDIGNTGPDYRFGWGLMDTQKAAGIISENSTSYRIHIKELTLRDGESITIPVKATGSEPLRTTIAWTDPPGTPAAISMDPTDLMLVNDLDMQLEDESSTPYQPYILDPSNPGAPAATGDNIRDNVEMVHISSPAAGEIFTITISHKGTLAGGSQDFSLIITGNEGVDYQQKIAEGNGEGWRFLSSPVRNSYQELLDPLWTQGPGNSDYPAASSSESNVRIFDGSDYVSVSDLATTMEAGSGLAVFVYEDDDYNGTPGSWPKTLTTAGMETLGDVDVTDLLNPGNDTFTLLGNPYDSTIDFDNFTNQSQVGSTVYVYDHAFEPDPFSDPDEPGGDSGGGFRAWNGSAGSLMDGLVASFQGFFVFATGNSPTLTIPESSKTTASTNFYKEKNPVPVIQIAAQINGKHSADTWFSFTDSGSLKKSENDAPYLYPLAYKPFLSLRSETNGLGYLIKSFPVSLDKPLQIPLTMEAWQPDGNQQNPGYIPLSGSAEMAWPTLRNIPESWTLTLTDHQKGTVIDLKKSSRYTFNLPEPKSKIKSMPYAMKMKAADETAVPGTRFTLTVYPGPLASDSPQETPAEFNLSQNYPNPFNPSTVIRYSLPEAAGVELDIFTIDGQKVATLVNEQKNAGNHAVTFRGENLSSGIYVYRLSAGQLISTRKMILIK